MWFDLAEAEARVRRRIVPPSAPRAWSRGAGGWGGGGVGWEGGKAARRAPPSHDTRARARPPPLARLHHDPLQPIQQLVVLSGLLLDRLRHLCAGREREWVGGCGRGGPRCLRRLARRARPLPRDPPSRSAASHPPTRPRITCFSRPTELCSASSSWSASYSPPASMLICTWSPAAPPPAPGGGPPNSGCRAVSPVLRARGEERTRWVRSGDRRRPRSLPPPLPQLHRGGTCL